MAIPLSTAALVRARGDRLVELASSALRDELGLEASLRNVRLELVPLTLVARDITLDDPVYGRFAEADELRIQPSFRALLRGAVDLNVIEIRGGQVRLVVRNGSVRNLPQADGGEPPPDGALPELPFDELRVVRSTLTIDAEPQAVGGVSGLDLTVRQAEAGIELDVRSRSGWVRHDGGRESLGAIAGRVELGADQVRVPALSAQSEILQVRLRDAELALPFDPEALDGGRGHIEVRYDLAHLRRLPWPEGTELPQILGTVELAATVETVDGAPRGSGSVTLTGARIDQFALGASTLVRFEATPDEVRILDGSAVENVDRGGMIELSGRIGLDPDDGFPMALDVGLDDLSFGKLMDDLGVTDNALVEWFFDGRARLVGTLEPLRLRGPFHARTHDFMVTRDGFRARPVRRVIGIPRGTIDARWSILPDGMRFEGLTAEMPQSRLDADIFLGFDNTLRVHATTVGGNLEDITPLERYAIAGVGNADVTIDGTFFVPNVRGHLAFEDFHFDTFHLGRVESDATLSPDGQVVTFPMARGQRGSSEYRAENMVLDFSGGRFRMETLVHLDGTDLTDLYDVFAFTGDERFTPYQGRLRGQADVRYTSGYPGDLPSGTLDVEVQSRFERAELTGYAFDGGELVAHWRWIDREQGIAGAELSVPHFSLSKGPGTVGGEGRMALGGDLDFTVVAARLDLSRLEGVGDVLVGIEGVGTALGRVRGTLSVPHADLDVGVTNVTYGGQPLGDGRAYVRLTDRDDPWVAETRLWRSDAPDGAACPRARRGLANANWPADPPLQTVDGPMTPLETPMAFVICGHGLDGHLDIDLAVGRTTTFPLRGLLAMRDLDLAPFLPNPETGDEPWGRLDGELAFDDGALRAPGTLGGGLRVERLEVGLGDERIANEGPVVANLDDGVLAIRRARFVSPDSRVRVRGRASWEDGLALRVNGDLDLGFLARTSRSLRQSSGHLQARVDVTGPLTDPELYGQAQVEDGFLRFTALDAPVENLTGTIRFSQRSVLFERFTADAAGGRIEADGVAEVASQRLERFAFDVSASALRYSPLDGVDLSFGGQTALRWARGERLPVLSGRLDVQRFEYSRPIELRSLGDVAASAVRGAFRRRRASVRRYDPEAETVRFDLEVAQQAPFRLRNNLIDAEVRVDTEEAPLRIVGTDQRFGVSGQMSLARGRLFFQNNDFDIRRGTIRFDDETRIDPRIDVEAVTEVRRSSDLSAPSWRITLTATGTADTLQLVTRSEPDLPEPDILMLLAFGLTRGELQLQQGAGEALASTAALEALTSVTGVDREVSRALPIVDDIRLTTGYSPRTGRSEPRISVGKRIAERIRLSATTGLSEAREFRAAAEWQLDERTRLQLSYDNYNVTGTAAFGNLGLDLGYRLEFE